MIADPYLYQLATRAAGSTKDRHLAYAEMLTTIKSQADLYRFLKYRIPMAGWSRGLRRAVNEWLQNALVSNIEIDPDLNIHGWTLCRLAQMSHPKRDLLEALGLTIITVKLEGHTNE